MKRKKTRSVASYRAASLKGARIKKQMRKYHYRGDSPFAPPRPGDLVYIPHIVPEEPKPNQYNRALPNPWFDMVRK